MTSFGVQRAWAAPPPAVEARPVRFRAVPRVALALVGLVAVVLLVHGLLDVHAVTRHFSVH
jgi:hypothetical protein